MIDSKSCDTCRHFRAAPYEAKQAGCYLPSNMEGKQKDDYLDEQQLPGDHEEINRKGDCADHAPRRSRSKFLTRLFSLES
ncbi:MAG: hypothetical protein AAF682_23825 [Planctomycetota bacterium]